MNQRSPFAVLLRHFFSGLFRLESAVDEDSYKAWLIQILTLVITACWYVPVNLHGRYVELHRLRVPERYLLTYASDCLSALLLMMLLVALLTVVQWTALFPSRRDHLVLTPLPITRLQFFSAKLGALLLFVTVSIVSMALIAGVALPGIASGELESRPLLLRMGVFAISALLTCYFTFLGLLSVQGVLIAILPAVWFERISFAVQVVFLVALLCAFPLWPYFPAAHLIATTSPWLAWCPPAWYWGMAEKLLGATSPFVQRLSHRGQLALLVALATATVTYLASYLQHGRHALESSGRESAASARWSWLDFPAIVSRLFRLPQARASCDFTLRTLTRTRPQKLVFLLISGIGVALVVESSIYMALHQRAVVRGPGASWTGNAVIAAPLTLSFFAMLGLRRAFRLPEEPAANWLFRLLEDPASRQPQLAAVSLSFLLLTAIPALLLCAPLQFRMFGVSALAVLLAQAGLMYTLSVYLLWQWRSIPFTVAQNPSRRPFIQSVVVHLIEMSLYSVIASGWIHAGLRNPKWFAILAIVLAGVLAVLRNLRKSHDHAPLEFDEPVPQVIEQLHLLTD